MSVSFHGRKFIPDIAVQLPGAALFQEFQDAPAARLQFAILTSEG
jgi:hypothetical protein